MGEYVVRAGYQRGAGMYLVWWSAIDQAWSGDQRICPTTATPAGKTTRKRNGGPKR